MNIDTAPSAGEVIKHPTREAWLNSAVTLLRPFFKSKGNELPEKLRVTCGWPSSGGTAAKKRTIGQCWSPAASSDGTTEIFSSPYLEAPLHITPGDGCGILPTLVHELVHAAVGAEAKHGKVFKKLAKAVGLEGKMTSTNAGPELLERLTQISLELGVFPHAKLDKALGPVKKQTTRMVKCTCKDCGYLVRISRKWLDEAGAPHCPKHGEMGYEIPDDLREDGDDSDSD